jgi:hypothetical protein
MIKLLVDAKIDVVTSAIDGKDIAASNIINGKNGANYLSATTRLTERLYSSKLPDPEVAEKYPTPTKKWDGGICLVRTKTFENLENFLVNDYTELSPEKRKERAGIKASSTQKLSQTSTIGTSASVSG